MVIEPGKTLTVIEGAGLGGSARITAYDAETNLSTLDGNLGTLDSTSQYEISYTMLEEFGGYPIRTESYTVVLTAPPAAGETVTVDVTPQITRTYNADLAFTASKGQRDAVQVTADKTTLTFDDTNWDLPQVVTVTAINDNVVDGGDAKVFAPLEQRVAEIWFLPEGFEFYVTINGQPCSLQTFTRQEK